MAENQSMIFYYEWLDTLDMFPPDKFMETFKAIVNLARNGESTDFDDLSQKIAYQFIANQIKRDKEKYQNTVKQRAEAGRKGGLAKQANARNAKQDLANLADNDNGDVNGDVTDNEYENVNVVQPTVSSAFSETSVSVSSPPLLCGAFGNVSLTQVQLDWLKENYPADYIGKINRLSEYMNKTGKTYQDHFKKIRDWAEQDEKKNLGKTAAPAGRGCDLESESKRPIPQKPDHVNMTDEEWKIHIEKLRE